MMKQQFLRRSLMYVPGDSIKKLEKSMGTDADAIISDLEDAVASNEKENARLNSINYIDKIRQSDKEVIIRINPLDTKTGIEDLLSIIPHQPDTILIPKANESVLVVADTILDAFDNQSIGLIPLIEDVSGVINANKLLGISKRINGVHLGGEDLTKERNVKRTESGEELRFARDILAYAGANHQIDIIDTPYTNFRDQTGLKRDCETAKQSGFSAKVCIHPGQIETINHAFSPSEEEIKEAVEIIESYEKNIQNGIGVYSLNGKMVDAPVVERARSLLNRIRNTTKSQ